MFPNTLSPDTGDNMIQKKLVPRIGGQKMKDLFFVNKNIEITQDINQWVFFGDDSGHNF